MFGIKRRDIYAFYAGFMTALCILAYLLGAANTFLVCGMFLLFDLVMASLSKGDK